MAYVYFKHLSRITVSYKVSRDKAFNIAKNLKYDRCGLTSMAYKIFDSMWTSANNSVVAVKREIMLKEQLAYALQ